MPFGGDQTGSRGGASWIRLVGTNEHVAAEAADRALGLLPQPLEHLLRGLGLRDTEAFGLGSERMREVRGRERLSREDGSRGWGVGWGPRTAHLRSAVTNLE